MGKANGGKMMAIKGLTKDEIAQGLCPNNGCLLISRE